MYANFDERQDRLEVWFFEFDHTAFTKGRVPNFRFYVKKRDEKLIEYLKKVEETIKNNTDTSKADSIYKIADKLYKHPNMYIQLYDEEEKEWDQYPPSESKKDISDVQLSRGKGDSKFDPIPWIHLVPADIKAQKERLDKSDDIKVLSSPYPYEIVDAYVRAKIRWYFDKGHPFNTDEKPIFFQLIKGAMWGIKTNAEKERVLYGDYKTKRIKSYRYSLHKTKEMVYTAIDNSGLDFIFKEILKGAENGFGEFLSYDERNQRESSINSNNLLSLPREEFMEKVDALFGNTSFKDGIVAAYESKQKDKAYAEKKGLDYIDLINVTKANATDLWRRALNNKEIEKEQKERKDERRRAEREYSAGIPKEKPVLDKTYSVKDNKLVESLKNILHRFVLKNLGF